MDIQEDIRLSLPKEEDHAILMKVPANKKTQKKKQILSTVDKNKLWEAFDQEKKQKKQDEKQDENQEETQLEDVCYRCNSFYVFNEDGFPTCSNK